MDSEQNSTKRLISEILCIKEQEKALIYKMIPGGLTV